MGQILSHETDQVTRYPNSRDLIYTGNRRVMDRILSWATQCDSKTNCRQRLASKSAHLPVRLLHILGLDDESRVQLVSGEGYLPPDSNYIILSHCWGGLCNLQLCAQTKERLNRGVPLSSLPRTFRDACQVTFLLGVRYIWIDSLCIVQDDLADWHREAPRMCSYYRSAWLCICALDSPNSEGGLFSHRELVTSVATYAYSARRRYGLENALTVHRRYDPFIKAERGVANSRGWIFQERVLAPRTVFFGRDDIYWECACFALSDLNPSGFIRYRDKVTTNSIRKKIGELKKSTNPSRYDYFQERLWHSVVERYASANLTYGKDRLIALAGIAQFVCEKLEDSYFAGLLGQHLVESLCWIPLVSQIYNPEDLVTKTNDIAPSWSWAKLNCPIQGAYHFMSPFGRTILATVTSAQMSCPPFSATIAGKVCIDGITIEPGWLGWTTYSSAELLDSSLLAQCSVLSPDWMMGKPLNFDFHGYREVKPSGGLVLPHLRLEIKGEGTCRNDPIALFLDEPREDAARADLNRSWLVQISRNHMFVKKDLGYVWRIGLILLPVNEGEPSKQREFCASSMNERCLVCRRIGVWLFCEPQIADFNDPCIEWLGERIHPHNAIEPLLFKWLKDRPHTEVTII